MRIPNAWDVRLSTSTRDENVGRVQELVLKKRKITIREVANILGISFVRSVHFERQCKDASDCRGRGFVTTTTTTTTITAAAAAVNEVVWDPKGDDIQSCRIG